MNKEIENYCKSLILEFNLIPSERKVQLQILQEYLKRKTDNPVNLIFVCTHNSRRSQFGQIWANVAAEFFNTPNIKSFSCGTEVTSFNRSAISALTRIGFFIEKKSDGINPIYSVKYSDLSLPSICFSKKFDHESIPKTNFVSIMTCSEADENCPYLPGSELRIATKYEDPKISDGTPNEETKYDFTSREIAREILYTFSKIKS